MTGRPEWHGAPGQPVPLTAGLATVHLLTGLWAGLGTFVPVVIGLSLALGLLPALLLGVPVFAATLAVSRVLGRLERRRYALTLGAAIPEPLPRDPRGSWTTRLRTRTAAPSTWRELGHHLLQLPLGAVGFVLVVAVWLGGPALLTFPVWSWSVPGDPLLFRTGWAIGLAVGPGLTLLVLAPRLVRGLARADLALARRTLGPARDDRLAARVGELERSRAAVVDSAEAERRRLERDLHDGAQQRLVALAMNLGRARARFDRDPAGARELVDEAHTDAKLALAELRDLARGLAPAVLTDRGLDAALSALAARAPVPVAVEVDPGLADGARPDRTVEAIAYFVVAEALTNVAKHAGASSATVVARRTRGGLRVVVTDDGAGGADPSRGSGLRGLADRVSGVDGTLEVHSPPGGPTVLVVELPCAS